MLVDILEEHVDEAVDLFGRRLLYLDMLDVTLGDLAELDRRLIAHLDALTASPEAAWEFCRPFLAEEEADGTFVAGWLATFIEGDDAVAEAVRKALTAGAPAVRDGVVWAWCLTNAPRFENALLLTCREGDPASRAAAIDALGFRRHDPGEILDRALREGEGNELIAALRCAGRLRAERARTAVETKSLSEDPELAVVAAEALVRIDPERGRRRCLELLSKSDEPDPRLIFLLGAVGEAGDVSILVDYLNLEGRASRQAAVALGNIGNPDATDGLICMLARPDRCGVASFALRQMFGVDALGDEMLFAASQTAVGQNNEPTQDSAVWRVDDDLPRLDRNSVAQWWSRHRDKANPDERLCAGQSGMRLEPTERTPLGLAPLVAIENCTRAAEQPLLELFSTAGPLTGRQS